MRVKRGFTARRYRKKILKRAKGYRGANSRLYTEAIQKSDRALVFQYRDRRDFKNDIKKVWNHRIGQAARNLGLSYSHFMGSLKKSNVQINRPQLAYLATYYPESFEDLAKKIQLVYEIVQGYERRKSEHIALSLKEKNQVQDNGLSCIKLIHEALPDLNWDQIDLSTTLLGKKHKTPFFVAGMTGGNQESSKINYLIAKACEQRGWIMGVGSQRKQLFDSTAFKEWQNLKESFPKLTLVGNFGLSQFIQTPIEKIEELFNSLGSITLFIHANSLQECLQPEGTPQFKGGIKVLKKWSQKFSLSLKETGCGFSFSTLESLAGIGLKAVDISGYGGTHWGRIETDRILDLKNKKIGETFSHWGNSTLSSLLSAQKVKNKDYEVWASGGLRNGLDGAKCIALGASAVGFAHLILKKALKGEKDLDDQMFLIEEELKIALFCTGCQNIQELNGKWEWI